MLDVLVLGLHDPAQRWVASLVDATRDGDHGGQRGLHHVVAFVGLPVDRGLAVGHFKLFGEAQQRKSEEFGELRGHRTRRAIGALGAADDEVEGLTLDGGGERPRGAERVGVLELGIGHQDSAVRAHGQCPPDRLEGPGRAHRDDHDLAAILLDQLEPGFDRVLVARVEDQVHPLPDEPLGLRVELAGSVGIRDLLDADEDVHGWLLSLWGNRA